MIPREPRPHVIDLRDRTGAMSWGVADEWGVVIAQFDDHDDAEKFCEFFEMKEGS